MKCGLLHIETFVIPTALITQTLHFLQGVGEKGYEGFVLWGGIVVNPKEFRFESSLIPAQTASVTRNGLLVTVESEALFVVNRTLHERGEILGAQIHSHPTEAYHSETDDQYPLATLMGSLSIVIPNFGFRFPDDFHEWAWYRLSKKSRWEPASKTTKIVIE